MKKLLLSLGSIVTIAAPIAAVVSCGSDTKETSNTGSKIDTAQEQMLKEMFHTAFTNINKEDISKVVVYNDGIDMSETSHADYAIEYTFNKMVGIRAGDGESHLIEKNKTLTFAAFNDGLVKMFIKDDEEQKEVPMSGAVKDAIVATMKEQGFVFNTSAPASIETNEHTETQAPAVEEVKEEVKAFDFTADLAKITDKVESTQTIQQIMQSASSMTIDSLGIHLPTLTDGLFATITPAKNTEQPNAPVINEDGDIKLTITLHKGGEQGAKDIWVTPLITIEDTTAKLQRLFATSPKSTLVDVQGANALLHTKHDGEMFMASEIGLDEAIKGIKLPKGFTLQFSLDISMRMANMPNLGQRAGKNFLKVLYHLVDSENNIAQSAGAYIEIADKYEFDFTADLAKVGDELQSGLTLDEINAINTPTFENLHLLEPELSAGTTASIEWFMNPMTHQPMTNGPLRIAKVTLSHGGKQSMKMVTIVDNIDMPAIRHQIQRFNVKALTSVKTLDEVKELFKSGGQYSMSASELGIADEPQFSGGIKVEYYLFGGNINTQFGLFRPLVKIIHGSTVLSTIEADSMAVRFKAGPFDFNALSDKLVTADLRTERCERELLESGKASFTPEELGIDYNFAPGLEVHFKLFINPMLKAPMKTPDGKYMFMIDFKHGTETSSGAANIALGDDPKPMIANIQKELAIHPLVSTNAESKLRLLLESYTDVTKLINAADSGLEKISVPAGYEVKFTFDVAHLDTIITHENGKTYIDAKAHLMKGQLDKGQFDVKIELPEATQEASE